MPPDDTVITLDGSSFVPPFINAGNNNSVRMNVP